jgi:DNA-directed RNA polymerase subunit RPC12/RpoP
MNIFKTYVCAQCRTKVPKERIKFDLSGIDLVCDVCFAKKLGLEKQRRKGISQTPSIIEERRLLKRIQEDSINYQCAQCKYKFSRKKSFRVSCCPYCSGSRVVEVFSGKAQELLESIDDETSLY